jgi:hypothetical protein
MVTSRRVNPQPHTHISRRMNEGYFAHLKHGDPHEEPGCADYHELFVTTKHDNRATYQATHQHQVVPCCVRRQQNNSDGECPAQTARLRSEQQAGVLDRQRTRQPRAITHTPLAICRQTNDGLVGCKAGGQTAGHQQQWDAQSRPHPHRQTFNNIMSIEKILRCFLQQNARQHFRANRCTNCALRPLVCLSTRGTTTSSLAVAAKCNSQSVWIT